MHDAPVRGHCYDCCQPGHTIGAKTCPNYLKQVALFGTDCISDCWKSSQSDSRGEGWGKSKKKVEANTALGSTDTPPPQVDLKVPVNSKGPEASAVEISTWSSSAPSSIVETMALAVSMGDNAGFIIIDSGSSHHIVNCWELFTSYWEYAPSERPVISGIYDGIKGRALGIGDIAIPTLSPKGLIWCQLSGALHVLDCSKILLSYWTLVSSGGLVTWHPKEVTPVQGAGGELLGVSWPSNSVWRIPIAEQQPVLPEASTTISTSSVSESILWHHRFGHLGLSSLARLASKSLVKGLPSALCRLTKCNECTLGKAVHLLFLSSNLHVSTPMELIHSDLSGLFPASVGGSQYWMILVDDASQYTWVLTLKQKSEAFEDFQAWHMRITTQTGRILKVLQTDNGSEYLSDEWTTYQADHGITHQTSTPYSSQQNGRTEHGHCTLDDRMCAMLIDAGLSVGWWAECVNTTVYIMN
jgi:hypothetical protein